MHILEGKLTVPLTVPYIGRAGAGDFFTTPPFYGLILAMLYVQRSNGSIGKSNSRCSVRRY